MVITVHRGDSHIREMSQEQTWDMISEGGRKIETVSEKEKGGSQWPEVKDRGGSASFHFLPRLRTSKSSWNHSQDRSMTQATAGLSAK